MEETGIFVVDETGRIVKEMRAASEPQALSAALREVDLTLERMGRLEACSLTNAVLSFQIVALAGNFAFTACTCVLLVNRLWP